MHFSIWDGNTYFIFKNNIVDSVFFFLCFIETKNPELCLKFREIFAWRETVLMINGDVLRKNFTRSDWRAFFFKISEGFEKFAYHEAITDSPDSRFKC